MNNLLKGNLTISRPSYGNGKEVITIQIVDERSRERFVTVEISYADFTRALTGASEIPCDLVIKRLERIGMKKETLPLEFLIPKDAYHNKDKAMQIANEQTPEGWQAVNYFNSQNSFFVRNGKSWAKTVMVRWVK